MKRSALIIALMLSAVCVIGCSDGGGSSDSANNPGGGGPGTLISPNIVIDDANGEVGKAVYLGYSMITLYSSKDYLYSINWAGEIYKSNSLYYTGSNCSGTPYVYAFANEKTYGKNVIYGTYNSKLYRPKTVNSDGTSYYDTSNKVTYNSYDSAGTCTNGTGSQYMTEMIETDRASVGIPTTITPPLKVVFE